MKKIEINTTCKKLLADVYTPVGIYLRVRDRFRDTILLESTDHHAAENSWSFICITMKQQNQYWWWHTNALRGL